MWRSAFFCVKGSQRKNLSLLSYQKRKNFDDLYRDQILGSDKLVSSTVDDTTVIIWATLQIHEVMAEIPKHKIKRYPSVTSIFVGFLITANISEPLQDIYQMNRDIKVLRTKSGYHHGRPTKLKG